MIQLLDGSHAGDLIDLIFARHDVSIRRAICGGVMGQLQDLGGLDNLLGCIVQLSNEVYAAAYILRYPGKVAMLNGPRRVQSAGQVLPEAETQFSSDDLHTAAQMCRILCAAAWKRWPLELIQTSHPPTDRFEAAAVQQAGFEFLSSLKQLEFVVSEQAGLQKSAIEQKLIWRRFESNNSTDRIQYENWLAATYIDTLDCPRLNDIRSIAATMDGYIDAMKGTSALQAAADQTLLPQWWSTSDENNEGEEAVAAAFMLTPVDRRVWELTYFGVASKHRNRGLGAATLQRMLKQLDDLNAERVFAYVDENNKPALNLYNKRGFNFINAWNIYFWRAGQT